MHIFFYQLYIINVTTIKKHIYSFYFDIIILFFKKKNYIIFHDIVYSFNGTVIIILSIHFSNTIQHAKRVLLILYNK